MNSVPCIWKLAGMKSVQHRIIWWLVDAGAAGYVVKHGWQGACADQLGIHRITLHRHCLLLKQMGALLESGKKGEVILNTDIFRPQANSRQLRKERLR